MHLKIKPTTELIARVLLGAAGLVSLYLGVISLGGTSGCGDGAGCGEVVFSEWSKVAGVPVAFAGVAIYLMAIIIGRPDGRSVGLRIALLLVIPGAAVWFVGVQLVAIGSFCLWCCAAHTLASAGAILLLLKMPATVDLRQWGAGVSGAFAAVLALAAGQTLLSGDDTGSSQGGSVVSVFSMADSVGETEEVRGALTLHGGAMQFEIADLPSVGSAKSEKFVLALTDYTCNHCRALHPVLDEVATYLGDEVSIVMLPATRKGSDAAKIHSDMLAVWKASPDAFRSLQRSLVEGRVPANADRVSAEARRLLSANQLANSYAQHQGWIEDQIAATRQLQDLNRAKTGRGTLPQVMIGSEITFGAHSDPAFYLAMIQDALGVANSAISVRPKPSGIGRSGSAIDLGVVIPGSETPFEIAFTNTSEMPLKVSWVNLDEGIALERTLPGAVLPGEKATLAMKLELPEASSPGPISKVVTINTTSGHPAFTFKITAQIDLSVAQLPSQP